MKHVGFILNRCKVNVKVNVVIVCKVLKSLHVVVHAKLNILSGLSNTKLPTEETIRKEKETSGSCIAIT